MSISKVKEKTKDGRQWRFQVYVEGKKYASKLYFTKREAIEEEKKFVLENASKDLEAHRITFNDAIKEYLEQEKQNTKASTYRQEVKLCEHISNALGNVVIEKMTVNQYKNFRNSLDEKGFSACYKNKVVNHCKSVIRIVSNRYGVYTRVPDTFKPFKDNEIKEEMKFYTYEQFKHFISFVDDIRYIRFFNVLFFNGLRCGEANGLQWKDVDLINNTIHIRKTINTKMRNEKGEYLITTPKTKQSNRILPISKPVADALKELRNYYGNCYGFNQDWFVFGGINALPESTINKVKAKYIKASGLPQIRIHDFRHSCVSFLIDRGCNITLIAKYMGHADIQKTLNTYSHFYQSRLDELVCSINNLEIEHK